MSGETLPREIEFEDKKDEIIAAAMMILGISIPSEKADGILIVTGEGEKERVHHGTELWRQDYGRFLLVTGDSGETKKKFDITRKMITDFCRVNVDHPDIFKQEEARHTLDQAIWVAGLVEELGIKSLIIITALYHMPRTFLTFLKTFQKNGQEIILIPSPVLPNSLEYNFRRIPAEIARIIKYQEQGDVATTEELYAHLQRQLAGQS